MSDCKLNGKVTGELNTNMYGHNNKAVTKNDSDISYELLHTDLSSYCTLVTIIWRQQCRGKDWSMF